MKIFFKILTLTILLLANSEMIAEKPIDEYELKAVFFEKFSIFIEWPQLKNSKSEFTIAIIGRNPFDDKLERIYQTRKIKDKNVKIVYIDKIEQIGDCHILFISSSEKNRLKQIMDYTRNKDILTISDTKGFAEKGVMMNFRIVNSKLKLQVNETATKASGLKFSYLLLKNSEIINPVGGRDE